MHPSYWRDNNILWLNSYTIVHTVSKCDYRFGTVHQNFLLFCYFVVVCSVLNFVSRKYQKKYTIYLNTSVISNVSGTLSIYIIWKLIRTFPFSLSPASRQRTQRAEKCFFFFNFFSSSHYLIIKSSVCLERATT